MTSRNLEVNTIKCNNVRSDKFVVDLGKAKDKNKNIVLGSGNSIASRVDRESVVIGTNCSETSSNTNENIDNAYFFNSYYGGILTNSGYRTVDKLGKQDVAIGRNHTSNINVNTLSIGSGCTNSGIGSRCTKTFIFGNDSDLIGDGISIGKDSNCARDSFCIGKDSYVSRNTSVAIGVGNFTYNKQVAIGYQAKFDQVASGVAIGTNVYSHRGATVIGKDNDSESDYCVIIGSQSNARLRSIALGHKAAAPSGDGRVVFNLSGQDQGTADGSFHSRMIVNDSGSLSDNGNTNITVSPNTAAYMRITISGQEYKVPLFT